MTKHLPLLVLAAVAALLAGCGGDEANRVFTSIITGRVVDINSVPVRNATVRTADGQTVTTTSGAFQLENQRDGELRVFAEINQNGVLFKGQTMVFNTPGDQTRSAVIVVAPAAQQGAVRGTVRDQQGNLLENAPVFAYNGAGSSQKTFTDSDGEFLLDDLIGGFIYEIHTMAQGFRSDTDNITVVAQQDVFTNLTLRDNPVAPNLQEPQFLTGISWVSPTDPTRSPGSGNAEAYDRIKEIFTGEPQNTRSEKQKSIQTRNLRSDLIAEVELQWDEQRFNELLGWGIYRAESTVAPLNGLDFFFDPLSAYYFDAGVNVRQTYSYAVTTLSSLYPDFPNQTESLFSNIVDVEVLDELTLRDPLFNPLEFRWNNGSNSAEYYIFLFDRFPGAEVDPFWDNAANPATGLSQVYNGPPLQQGQTYWYVVLGAANNLNSRTISQIDSFQL